ncbi:MAG: hypothetical protein V2A79_19305 [Planctomycetota bacterium]
MATPAKKIPKFIFGKLNPAYSANASQAQVAGALKAIADRAHAAGLNPSPAAILATYKTPRDKRLKENKPPKFPPKKGGP